MRGACFRCVLDDQMRPFFRVIVQDLNIGIVRRDGCRFYADQILVDSERLPLQIKVFYFERQNLANAEADKKPDSERAFPVSQQPAGLCQVLGSPAACIY